MSAIAKPKSRLGRGLSSLLSISELPVEGEIVAGPTAPDEASAPEKHVVAEATTPAAMPLGGAHAEIPIEWISPNPHQPRKHMDDFAIAELAASIKNTGLIQPIIVRRSPDAPDRYQLIAGERRWRAARMAGLTSVPAIVREVDSFTQAQMALIENIQREDLNAIDRAESYRALITQLGLTQAELAARLGEDRSSIANFLRLLDLTEPVRNLVRDGKLTLGHAKILAGVDDILEQQRLADLVIAQELSVRNLERLTQSGDAPTSARQPAAGASGSAHIQDLEKSIARQLGMRVQVRSGKKGRGRLVIHYASLDQFDELMGKLGVSVE